MYHKKQVIADSKIHCISKNGSCLATYDGNYIIIYRLWNGFYELCRKLNLEEVASIALDNNGDTLVVGTYRNSVYVFHRKGNDWQLRSELLSSDRNLHTCFGQIVSISKDSNTIAVGSCDERGIAGDYQGSVYVYVKEDNTWIQETKLDASDANTNDWFGCSVDVNNDGTSIVVGARNKKGNAGDCQGSAYVFLKKDTEWKQHAKLEASDACSDDWFGYAVKFSGNGKTIIVGAHNKKGKIYSNQGAAYIFSQTGNEWVEEAKLEAIKPGSNDLFGDSLDISEDGNYVVVAAENKTNDKPFWGVVYVFVKSKKQWGIQNKLVDKKAGLFGRSVSISADGKIVTIGSSGKNSKNKSLYVFQ